MAVRRSAAIAICILFTMTAGMSQQQETRPLPTRTEATTTYFGSVLQPAERLETRTTTGGTETVTETIQRPSVDGRYRPFTETTTETTRIGANRVETSQSVFRFNEGRRVLVETTR